MEILICVGITVIIIIGLAAAITLSGFLISKFIDRKAKANDE